jgi:hypothetical protein
MGHLPRVRPSAWRPRDRIGGRDPLPHDHTDEGGERPQDALVGSRAEPIQRAQVVRVRELEVVELGRLPQALQLRRLEARERFGEPVLPRRRHDGAHHDDVGGDGAVGGPRWRGPSPRRTAGSGRPSGWRAWPRTRRRRSAAPPRRRRGCRRRPAHRRVRRGAGRATRDPTWERGSRRRSPGPPTPCASRGIARGSRASLHRRGSRRSRRIGQPARGGRRATPPRIERDRAR